MRKQKRSDVFIDNNNYLKLTSNENEFEAIN